MVSLVNSEDNGVYNWCASHTQWAASSLIAAPYAYAYTQVVHVDDEIMQTQRKVEIQTALQAKYYWSKPT